MGLNNRYIAVTKFFSGVRDLGSWTWQSYRVLLNVIRPDLFTSHGISIVDDVYFVENYFYDRDMMEDAVFLGIFTFCINGFNTRITAYETEKLREIDETH